MKTEPIINFFIFLLGLILGRISMAVQYALMKPAGKKKRDIGITAQPD